MHVPVTAVAKLPRRGGQIRHHRNRKTRISRECLFKAQICGDSFYIAAVELFQLASAAIPPVHARLAIAHAMNVEVERHKVSSCAPSHFIAPKISAPIGLPVPCREIQNLFHLAAFHRCGSRIEIKRGTPSPRDGSEAALTSNVA